MDESSKTVIESGDEVMRAVGELSVTAKAAATTLSENQIDHEEVRGWLTTIIKAVMDILK